MKKINLSGDNEVDVCEAIEFGEFKYIKDMYPDIYEEIVGYFIPIINAEREKYHKDMEEMRKALKKG
jgi:hypothetical protein